MSLSSLIVQREIASIREIEEALARQVLYGGDFVTNLLEVSRIEESALMPVVAESFGLEAAPSGELPRVPEEASRLVAAEVAAERAFAPLAIGTSLVVAVAEPLSRDVEQELTFALALPIEQRIAPLFRIRQALARDYGVPIDKRIARLITKVIHKGPKIASTFPPPIESQPRLPKPPSMIPPAPAPSVEAPRTTATAQGTFVRAAEAPPPRPIRRRRGPLTADVANQELEASAERDVVFDILFEFARQFFDYTALFIVHGDIAEGRDAFGDGASRDKVARVGVPLDLPNVLADARTKKRRIRATPSREGLDPVLMTDLGRDGATECIVFPIIVRKRVVALLFGDGGTTGIDDAGVKQVDDLVLAASGAFERVIMRRKLNKADAAPMTEGGVAAARRKAAESIAPPPTQLSGPPAASPPSPREHPSADEMAAPIRELMAEPSSRLGAMTPATASPAKSRDPAAALVIAAQTGAVVDPLSARSDRPPPANLLAVRRPSGQPIPREEPEASFLAAAEAAQIIGGAGVVATTPASERPPPARTKSGSLKRAEAPPLEFGTPSMPSVITENTFGADSAERQLIAQIQGNASPSGVALPTSQAHSSEPPKTTRDPENEAASDPSSPPHHPWGRDPSASPVNISDLNDSQQAMSEAFSEAPYSPKASSPPPMRVAAPITDLSPQPIGPIGPIGPITDRSPPELVRRPTPRPLPAVVVEPPPPGHPGPGQPGEPAHTNDASFDLNPSAITTKVRLGPELTPGPAVAGPQPGVSYDDKTPTAPPMQMTPDPDATPVVSSVYDSDSDISLSRIDDKWDAPSSPRPGVGEFAAAVASAADPVLVLSQRKGHPPVIPVQPEVKPMPASEQQVSVKPHKPPSSRSDHSRVLPSVIVDTSSEYVTLVDRVLAGPDEDAETDLLRAGGYAMPAIMAKFPGPIAIEEDRLVTGPLPRVAECGPVIRLVASQRRTALPFVLSHVASPDVERRFWATYLLTELVYPDAIDAAIGRVFDEEARVRRAANAAIRALAEAHPTPVVERLADVVTKETESPARRAQAIEALGEAREPSAFPILLQLHGDSDAEIASATRVALVTISRQDFGKDGKKWTAWWEQNKGRHRLEWLIDSLMHDQRTMRAAASDELKTTTKEYFAYYDDLPKRERERSQARYREWWENIGRVRFSRASTRGA